MENLITTRGMDEEQIKKLFKEADELRNKDTDTLENKTLAMLFEKPSTRTRISFEEGTNQLNGDSIFLSKKATQLGRGEPIKDTARVLTRYVDGVMARLHEHRKIQELEKHSDIPVINGLTDKLHPCQSLTDYYTIWRKKNLNAKVVFLGDGSDNVCHSLINTSNSLNQQITIACPDKYKPEIKGRYNVEKDPEKAVENADVVYTDVWKSMGEGKMDKEALEPYQVNRDLINRAKDDCIFMHCLPAHRGEEVTDEIVEGKHSVVFDQAENRLHLQKALLANLMED